MTATEFSELIRDNFEELFDFVEDYKGKNGKTTEELLKEHNIEFVENNDKEAFDSYGSENSVLERIYLHQPSGKYFMIYGTRQSYSGTEWDGIKEVNKTEKNNYSMDIKQTNEILSNLYEYTLESKFTKVATEEPRDFYSEGDCSTKIDIYKLNIEDWHLKVSTTRDSYGDNPTITSIKFVKPVIKQITDFE